MDWRDRIRAIADRWLFSDIADIPFPATVILPLENPDLHDHDRFTAPLADLRHGRSVSIGLYRGRQIAVMRSKFGAPAVALAVEVLAMRGVRNVLGVGFCGALQPGIACGDLVLPREAIRDDGTTPRYVASDYSAKADPGHLSRLTRAAAVRGQPWHTGTVWSTDAVLQETSARVAAWAQRGALAVDMEAGALFTLADVSGIQAAAVLVASDNAALGREADPALLDRGVAAALELAFAWAAWCDGPEA